MHTHPEHNVAKVTDLSPRSHSLNLDPNGSLWNYLWKQISALGNKVIAVFFLLCQQRYQWLIGDAFNIIGVFYLPLPDLEERPRVITS